MQEENTNAFADDDDAPPNTDNLPTGNKFGPNSRQTKELDALNQLVYKKILKQLATSDRSLQNICKDLNVNYYNVLKQFVSNDFWSPRYKRAMELRGEYMLHAIIDIADNGTEDVYLDAKGNEKINYENIKRSEVKIKARQWLVETLLPNKYGKKAQLKKDDNKGDVAESARRAWDERGKSRRLPSELRD